MKRWLKIASVVVICLWEVGLTSAMEGTQTEWLLFEHIGPEDASIPPFVVEIGRVAESTHAIILVTPKTYVDILMLVNRARDAPPRSPRPMGTFCVISFKDRKLHEEFTIYPEAVLSVINRLRQMFQSRHSQIPEVLVKLETLLMPRK